jgi:hypothetical protein
VAPQIRAALLDAFSFERRELGQGVVLSEAISVMQRVPGVAYVDVEEFRALREDDVKDHVATIGANQTNGNDSDISPDEPPDPYVPVALARLNTDATDPAQPILPAQIAYLTPTIPETLILNLIESSP